MVEKISQAVGTLKGKTLAILGLAFKPNTDDIRDSVSINIIRALKNAGAHIRAFDPVAMDSARKVIPDIDYCRDAYHAVEGSDALILVTEWNQFRHLDLERLRRMLQTPIFIDLRNVYEPQRVKELGFLYVGVGRGTGQAPA